MRSFCLIVLFAAIAAIDAQTPRGPPHAFPTLEPVETTEPQDPIETEFPDTLAPVGKYPFLMRGGRPDAVEQDRPADFINFGGNGGTPFRGFKKPTAADAKSITGKTIAIIMSTLFVVAAAAVVAVIIIRKKRSA